MLIRNIAIILSIGDGIGLLIESSTPSGVFGLSKDKNIIQYAEKEKKQQSFERKLEERKSYTVILDQEEIKNNV